jgi:hypothetical protein
MNDYERYLHFDIETVMSDYEYVINESHMETLKQLISEYDKVSMDDWFEDKPIVEKSIPEFNFV